MNPIRTALALSIGAIAMAALPQEAAAISYVDYRICVDGAEFATDIFVLSSLAEAGAIAACTAAYNSEQAGAGVPAIGRPKLGGQSSSLMMAPGQSALLTFGFIDPATGLPVAGPATASVLYEEQVNPPDITNGTTFASAPYTPIGSSTDVADGFPVLFTATSSEEDIVAIPFDASGAPIFIQGVVDSTDTGETAAEDNVAKGDVVQLNIPEPTTAVLFGTSLLLLGVGSGRASSSSR
jgi:hypothetical protein